jgi:hypothetical protein
MSIQIVFEGDFAANHQLSLRTLSQTYTGLQKALERSYLDITREGISKGEKITDEERRATEFYLEEYARGSVIARIRESTQELSRAIDRLCDAMINPYALANEKNEIKNIQFLKKAETFPKQTNASIPTHAEAVVHFSKGQRKRLPLLVPPSSS